MAELTFKSAGVSTREIDLSTPVVQGPQGVPAGIIGTSVEGPAFVPITVATFSEYEAIFGQTDGKKFGPLAVNEWLKNARSCTYIRVMGAGDCKKRNTTTGKVTNAGFIVGNRTIQANGNYGNSLYGNTGDGSVLGRTYFLGCLMSESNGSTIFSSAGIQNTHATASLKVRVPGTAPTTLSTVKIKDVAGATYILSSTNAAGVGITWQGNNIVTVGTNGIATAETLAYRYHYAVLTASVNGMLATSDERPVPNSEYGNNGYMFYIDQDLFGPIGNTTVTSTLITAPMLQFTGSVSTSISGSVSSSFAGGAGGANPIIRGVLMAPSGVILTLSGNAAGGGNVPVKTNTAGTAAHSIIGRTGASTGSVNLTTQQFCLLLNGFNEYGGAKNVLTASFDMTAPDYFANVLNTDPLKTEEKGHLLYTHYDVYPTLASLTGSGVITVGRYSSGSTAGTAEDAAFLLTSSLGRSPADSASATIPNYENFEDRFRHAESPYIISQNFGAGGYDLFNIVYLSPGVDGNSKVKISIENLRKSTADTYKYGTFDLIIRSFYDSDDEKVILESFRGINLDPNSDRFAPRIVGDQNIYFDFENTPTSQKIIVAGDYPVKSRYIRLQQSTALTNGQIPAEALPVGYRGPFHLVTSGTLLAYDTGGSCYGPSNLLQKAVELPVPYRETIALGTGLKKRADSRLYWGAQFTRKTSVNEPNKAGLLDASFNAYAKYFPRFNKDRTAVSVGQNQGAALSAGSILDCDLFNNNKFTLERLKVRTGSDTDGGYADPEYWLSASYVRDGNISADNTLKTRAWQVSDLDRVGNRTFSKFTFFLQGGFGGTNMYNLDQLDLTNTSAKREMDFASDQGGTSGPTVAAYRKALDVMGSKSDVDIQLLAIPGMRHSSISDYAISTVENRFDAMYIMDIEERDQFNTVITSSGENPHVLYTANSFKGRALDTSFAAAYFPDAVVIDPTTYGNVQVPPSVPVLGAFGLNDQIGHPWFAPAGFSRGALNSVELSSVRLNRTNLDDLYESDINPITAFPGTGVVVWGQKTLLASPSALDRVNVRRLLINIRRKVKNVANSLLFEPNRSETLEKFTALVNPIMQRVQEQSGVDRYKVIIDTTTTSQADVENNTIRGKIFLQPTRTAEFISLDFVVTNAGANI